MQTLPKQFQYFNSLNNLIQKEDKLLLAVSGGVDSVVMTELISNLGIDFAIAHCNYDLRGGESHKDEELVKTVAHRKGVTLHTKKITIGEGAIQLEARNARYEWFSKLSKKIGYTKIATAHHQNDSLETTLMNLSRGTGVKGLAGIAAQNGKIIRPILFATKQDIYHYAKVHSLLWREDASNNKLDYDRNKIRHQVIPHLEKLNPSLINTYSRTKERLELMQKLIEKKLKDIEGRHYNSQNGEFQLDWVCDQSDLLVLAEFLNRFGFNYQTARAIFAARGKSGKQFLGLSYEVLMDRSSFFLKPFSKELTVPDLVVQQAGIYAFGDRKILIEGCANWDKPLDQGKNIALLDHSKVSFPLKIRSWNSGDSFVPLGMKGTKKVSDYLIDKKVPVAEKEKILVVEINGEIAWLVGYRISELFKAQRGQDVLSLHIF